MKNTIYTVKVNFGLGLEEVCSTYFLEVANLVYNDYIRKDYTTVKSW